MNYYLTYNFHEIHMIMYNIQDIHQEQTGNAFPVSLQSSDH